MLSFAEAQRTLTTRSPDPATAPRLTSMTLWKTEAPSAMNSLTVILPSSQQQLVKPIAPKINNRQRKDAQVDSTTSTSMTTMTTMTLATTTAKAAAKRKIAFHPSLGYAIPPPIPPKVARRNARERNRVKQVNNGFDVLRSHIPTAAKNKKMSKVDTLRHAVEYIRNLKKMVKEQDLSNGIKCEIDDDADFDDRNDEFDFDDDDDNSQQSFDDSSIVSSPSSVSFPATTSTTTTVTTPASKASQFMSQRVPQLNQTCTRTPDSTSEFILNNVPPALIPSTTTLNVGNESGYETSSYYSQPPSLMSPDSGHFSLHHQQHPMQHHHHHLQQQQHLLASVYTAPEHHSPINSVETSPSVFSDSSSFFPGGSLAMVPAVPQSYYYTDCMEPNSEEDELLDAIVKWQED